MYTITLVLMTAVVTLATDTVLFPTTRVTRTDEWQCATENLSQYFNVPKPTATLSTALNSYGMELFKSCTSTGLDKLTCPFPDKSKWCDFTSFAKPELLPAYTSFGSVAASWWSALRSHVARKKLSLRLVQRNDGYPGRSGQVE